MATKLPPELRIHKLGLQKRKITAQHKVAQGRDDLRRVSEELRALKPTPRKDE